MKKEIQEAVNDMLSLEDIGMAYRALKIVADVTIDERAKSLNLEKEWNEFKECMLKYKTRTQLFEDCITAELYDKICDDLLKDYFCYLANERLIRVKYEDYSKVEQRILKLGLEVILKYFTYAKKKEEGDEIINEDVFSSIIFLMLLSGVITMRELNDFINEDLNIKALSRYNKSITISKEDKQKHLLLEGAMLAYGLSEKMYDAVTTRRLIDIAMTSDLNKDTPIAVNGEDVISKSKLN